MTRMRPNTIGPGYLIYRMLADNGARPLKTRKSPKDDGVFAYYPDGRTYFFPVAMTAAEFEETLFVIRGETALAQIRRDGLV